MGERAAGFIAENADKPFILYVSTFEPHSPYNGPNDGMYDAEALPTGPEFLKQPDGAALVNRVRANYFMQYLEGGDPSKDDYISGTIAPRQDVATEAGWRRLRAGYFGNISLVDDMVGKITGALESAGIAGNTAVMFTSDHGMLEKRSFYEEASRVPLLMRVPWLSREQTIVPGNAGHIDLVPTALDLVGEPVPTSLQGRSLLPVLQGDGSLGDNRAFIQWNVASDEVPDRFLGGEAINTMLALPWRSMVSGGWKLNLCAGDQCELFDLESDPYEMTNLYDDPAQRDRVRLMAAQIRGWRHQTGDTAPLPAV